MLSTIRTNIPFFLFNTVMHRNNLRENLANTFRKASQSWKNIAEVASTRFEIDPFDVACLIAMAQKQAIIFRMFNFPEPSMVSRAFWICIIYYPTY